MSSASDDGWFTSCPGGSRKLNIIFADRTGRRWTSLDSAARDVGVAFSARSSYFPVP